MRDNDLVWLFEVGTKLEIRSEITTPLLGVALACSEATEISVNHTTEISVKSSAKAEETSYQV